MNRKVVMRRAFAVVTLVLCVLLFSSPSSALLMRTPIDSSFVVVDDVNGVQWADITRFTQMSYAGVMAEIDAMNSASFAGASDWHLASEADMNFLFDINTRTVGEARQFDPTNVFNSSGTDYVEYYGRYDDINQDGNYALALWTHEASEPDMSTSFFRQDIPHVYVPDFFIPSTSAGAFVASSTSASTPVPEPATILLIGTGLVGFAVPYIRKKRRK